MTPISARVQTTAESGLDVAARILRRATKAAAALVAEARRRSNARWAAAQLNALDDRTLRDMGIYRSEINSIVRHGFDGRVER